MPSHTEGPQSSLPRPEGDANHNRHDCPPQPEDKNLQKEVNYLWQVIQSWERIDRLLRSQLCRAESQTCISSLPAGGLENKLRALEQRLVGHYEAKIKEITESIKKLHGQNNQDKLLDVLTKGLGTRSANQLAAYEEQLEETTIELRNSRDQQYRLQDLLNKARKEINRLEQQLHIECDSNLGLLQSEHRLQGLVEEMESIRIEKDILASHLHAEVQKAEEKAHWLEEELTNLRDLNNQAQDEIVNLRQEKAEWKQKHNAAIHPLQNGTNSYLVDVKPKKEETDAVLHSIATDWERKYFTSLVISYRDWLSITKMLEAAISGGIGQTQHDAIASILHTVRTYQSQHESELLDGKFRQTFDAWRRDPVAAT